LIHLAITLGFALLPLNNPTTVRPTIPSTLNTVVAVKIQRIEPVAVIQPLETVITEKLSPIAPKVETPVIATPVASGSHTDWMLAAGISPSDFAYVDYIVGHESGWRYNASNPSGAYGLCQSLPASKMASAGSDYLTNPVTQLRWCSSYAAGKGGWGASYNLWTSQRWW
jgi:hypothetical protein